METARRIAALNGQVQPSVGVSIAFADIPAPDFADAVMVAIPPSDGAIPDDPAWWAGRVFSIESAPRWVIGLLGLRQALVRLIGVDRADRSVFDIDRVEGGEALIAEDDTHLDFRAAVYINPSRRLLQVTTVVKLNGWRGKVYWIPVSVLHAPITRSMAKRAVKNFAANRNG